MKKKKLIEKRFQDKDEECSNLIREKSKIEDEKAKLSLIKNNLEVKLTQIIQHNSSLKEQNIREKKKRIRGDQSRAGRKIIKKTERSIPSKRNRRQKNKRNK